MRCKLRIEVLDYVIYTKAMPEQTAEAVAHELEEAGFGVRVIQVD